MTDAPEPNNDFDKNVFDNFHQLFFNPEITRRTAVGKWQEGQTVLAAQVLFFPNGRTPMVRLNEEVAAEVKVKKGLPIDDANFYPSRDEVEYIRLSEEEFMDCGHATMLLLRDGYQLSFDFTYNRLTGKRYLQIASEYMAMTRLAIDKQHWIAGMDTAYTAMELLARVSLLLETNEDMKKIKRHNAVVSAFHLRHRHTQDPDHLRQKQILQRLFDIRNKAKYGHSGAVLDATEMYLIAEETERMHQLLSTRIKTE